MAYRRKLRQMLWICADVLWICFIFGRSLKTADLSDRESAWFLLVFQRLLPWVTIHMVRKLAHFGEYFLLGTLLYFTVRSFKGPMPLPPALAGLLVAACDEAIQLGVPGRSGQITDVLLDECGVLCACVLLWLLHRASEKKKQT